MTAEFAETAARRLTRREALVRGLGVLGGAGAAAGLIGYDFRHRRRRRLRRGDHGDDVREVQIRVAGWARDLGDLGRSPFLPITGRYGADTARCVQRFQLGYAIEPDDGEVGEATWDRLDRLARPDDSTLHFDWIELLRRDADRPVAPEIRENARRLMYKLEALRRKLGDLEITIKAGYVATATAGGEEQIGDDRLHAIAAAVDFTAFGAPRPVCYRTALTSGFTGLGPIDRHWQHVDSRSEYPALGLAAPWYASGPGESG
jgi:zinc D-Ala-D-Ala carboxypeptidase